MKKVLLLTFAASLLLLSNSAISQQVQNYMNADGMVLAKKMIENPQLVDKLAAYEATLKQISQQLKSGQLKTDTLINGRRIIPVVFHIIHTYGPENISDAQVQDAVEKMTIDYNLLNADTSSVFPLFKSREANMQIEFRLAKIDPNGNCTTGIDRVYDPRTNYAYYSVMHDYAWTPSHYMNIFAVDFIYPEGITLPPGAFIGGMSPFPPSNTLTQALTGGDTLMDGVLIRQDCIGSIGTAADMGGMGINAMNRTLTHESGHYFNLYHPFNTGILCTLFGLDGCGSATWGCGDQVDDTPPVQAATQNTSLTCFTPGSKNTCTSTDAIYGGIDAPDMIENYMDYQWGYCTNMFTLGQKDRIDATMAADRLKLWSYENLVATGVLDTNVYLCSPKADFNCNNKMICEGSTVTFTDFSYNGAASGWQWSFPGGTPSTSTLQNPTITYNVAGTYNVQLKAINTSGSDSIIKQNLITVSDPATAQDAPFIEGFETNINNWVLNNMDGNPWTITDSAKYSGTKSLWVSNFSNNYPNSVDEIITPGIDLTAFSPAPTSLLMKFKLAYTGKLTTNALTSVTDTSWDFLKVFVSMDCGQTWAMRYSKSGVGLSTSALTANRFFPASASDWREESVNLNPYMTGDHVRFKFQFISGGGNNVYIDDINISVPAGVEDIQSALLTLNVHPNPMSETSEISFNLTQKSNVKIEILDVVGKEIMTVASSDLNAGLQTFTINKTDIGAEGFYFVKLTVDGVSRVQKIIVN